ncbi:terminase small subunit [Fundidesulfovibrio terrae]|uniref:terminase small subunit n=1 Tax=Fundidesulfovibrio terrae TaxID=2922866 RepID=UPI00243569CD|nr:terminase small subunit [Fundidesulfovibrio terrae]
MNNRLYPTRWNVPGATVKGRKGYVAGREPLYNNCMDLEAAIELYFEYRGEDRKPATYTGLTAWLGFRSPDALDEYKNPSHPFHGVVFRARQRIEDALEISLHQGKTTAGAIFTLKHHANWRDTRNVEVSGKFTIVGIAGYVREALETNTLAPGIQGEGD